MILHKPKCLQIINELRIFFRHFVSLRYLMNRMPDIGCYQGGIEASSIEHILSFKMRGLACCCGEFSKFYKYFYFRQIWLREKKIEKKEDMNRKTYYICSFIDLNSNLEGTQNILIISCRFTNKFANLGWFILTRKFIFCV